jgi:hypothetical protein
MQLCDEQFRAETKIKWGATHIETCCKDIACFDLLHGN